jgi:hypothetical protein
MKRSIDKNHLFVLFISKLQEEIFVHAMEKIVDDITPLYNKQDIIILIQMIIILKEIIL